MKLSEAMTAVVDRIKSPGVAGLNAEEFDGREEREDIAARSRKAGMWARVVVLGERERGITGDKTRLEVQFAGFLSLPFRPHPDAKPWALMADLRASVTARLRAINDWPEDMSSPTDIRGQNLYVLKDSKDGFARSLLQWTQVVEVDLNPEPVDLPDLEKIVHDQKHIVDGEEPAPTITTEINFP